MNTVKIAELKSRLSEHLRRVRRGRRLVVLDRSTPIAELIPYREPAQTLPVRHAAGRSSLQAVPLPPPLDCGVDAVELLLEDRQADR